MTSRGDGDGDFETLAQRYAWPAGTSDTASYVRLNMAVAGDGESIDAAGTSTGLSFAEDRRLLKTIRSDAQAVVVGASTVRAEGWNLPATGLLVVLSTSGNLPWATCPDRERVRVSAQSSSMRELINGLAEEGVHNVLVEGGVSIARLFAQENLFDDVCLTVSANPSVLTTATAPAAAVATTAAAGDADGALRALRGLLGDDGHSFDLVSLVPAAQADAVFTLWRRALDSPQLTAH